MGDLALAPGELTGPDRPEYALGRDHFSSLRLSLQHFLWKNTLGFLLHPVILDGLQAESCKNPPTANKQTLVIADVGTGTGAWIFDLNHSPELAGYTLKLYGMDISTAQFPHKLFTPENVEMSEADAFADPPEHLCGKCDIVHLRLLALAIRGGDAGPVIRHAWKLLKPGGYIQWDETDQLRYQNVVYPVENATAPNFEKLMDANRSNGDFRWVTQLSDLLAKEGFEQTSQDVYHPRPEWLPAFTWMKLTVTSEVAHRLPNKEKGRMMQGLLDKVDAEIQDPNIGAMLELSPTVTVGKKPLV